MVTGTFRSTVHYVTWEMPAHEIDAETRKGRVIELDMGKDGTTVKKEF